MGHGDRSVITCPPAWCHYCLWSIFENGWYHSLDDVLVTQSCLTLYTRLLCPRNSPVKNTGVGSHFLSPRDLSDPGIISGSPALQAESLPSEPPGLGKWWQSPDWKGRENQPVADESDKPLLHVKPSSDFPCTWQKIWVTYHGQQGLRWNFLLPSPNLPAICTRYSLASSHTALLSVS